MNNFQEKAEMYTIHHSRGFAKQRDNFNETESRLDHT